MRHWEFFEKISEDHKERTEWAKEIVELIKSEDHKDEGIHSKDWFDALDEEWKLLKLTTEEDVLKAVEKLLQKKRYFP